MDDKQLLAEFEELLQTMPEVGVLFDGTNDSIIWLARTKAAIDQLSPSKRPSAIDLAPSAAFVEPAHRRILFLLHTVIRNLQLSTGQGLSAVVEKGAVYDYFDSVRKIIQSAKNDLFLIDPYLNVDVVSRYVPFGPDNGTVRLLADRHIAELRAALPMAATQYSFQVQLRSAQFHDRYVFIDGVAGYQSGASFKDGAKNSLTTLTQVFDAFNEVKAKYETLWANATIVL